MTPNLNILIPMAGVGSRFSKSHPNQIKPLIHVGNKPMIEMVLSNLNQLDNINFIIVTMKKIGENQEFIDVLNELNLKYQLILIEELTKGPASTCLLAKEFINNDDPLIIVNCDQYIIDFNLRNLIDFSNINSADGIVGVFHSNSKKNSYVKLAEDFTIQEIKEKIVIFTQIY